jgi:hypothetical protein
MQAQTKCAMHGHESSAAVNPALTVMANALRVGDHLTAQLR